MNFKILGSFLFFWVLGCYPVDPDVQQELPEETSGDGGSIVSPVSNSTSSDHNTTESPVEEDDPRGPCPVDTYVLWEENGIKYTVEIEVFCDPIMNLNLGCPAPFKDQ